MSKQYTIPIFVPHYGCPFDCVFCNQEKITGMSTDVDSKLVRDTIEEYLSYFNKDAYIEVGFFGGSFTGIDASIQEELLAVAYEYKKMGKIGGIRLSTRPDFINDDVLLRLKKYGVDTVELGVQSLNDEILRNSGRGHSVEIVYRAAKLLRDYGLNLGLQMMVGLPGDSFLNSLKTVHKFIDMDPYCVRIYPTLVIKDTDLEREYLSSNYKPLDLETAVDWVSVYMMLFELNDINIIRVGLQPTENIQMGRDVVAGPFHPSFKQLVEAKVFRDLIDFKLEGFNLKNKNLNILSSGKNISSITGQKSSNKNYLIGKYGINKLKFLAEPKVNGKDLTLEFEEEKIYIDYKKEVDRYLIEKDYK